MSDKDINEVLGISKKLDSEKKQIIDNQDISNKYGVQHVKTVKFIAYGTGILGIIMLIIPYMHDEWDDPLFSPGLGFGLFVSSFISAAFMLLLCTAVDNIIEIRKNTEEINRKTKYDTSVTDPDDGDPISP